MAILNRENFHRLTSHFPLCSKVQTASAFVHLFISLLSMGIALEARAQTVSREYPLKAVFLLNFAQFTTWPTNAFADTNSPFIIGVLGNDPFGQVLDDAVRSETWNGHKIAVQRYSRLEDLGQCHILFVCQSEARQMERITASMKGKPVLTVSDADAQPYRNVIIRLVTENNRIRFKINLNSLRDSHLTVSSKLLRVAEVELGENSNGR
jgi:hypothetical protein